MRESVPQLITIAAKFSGIPKVPSFFAQTEVSVHFLRLALHADQLQEARTARLEDFQL